VSAGAADRGERLAFAAAGLLLAILALIPLAALLADLAGPLLRGDADVLTTLAEPRLWRLLGTTVLRALLVTAGATAIGTALALLLARTDIPGRRVLLLLHLVPAFLPPLLVALGWSQLLDSSGMLGSATTSRLFFSEVGASGVLVLTFAPFATILVTLALWGFDASLEEAARSVAGTARVALRIVLPATASALGAAAILIFALALSELGVPLFHRVKTYAAAVFARLGGVAYEPGEAAALAVPLLLVAAILLACERRVAGGREAAVLGLRGARRDPWPLGRWRAPATVCATATSLLSVAPIGALAARAARDGGFASVPQWIGSSVTVSLVTAAAGATLITAIGFLLGHALARRRPAARALDALAVLAFVTPAAALGAGIVATWNHPATAAIYGSEAILVLGFAAHYAVVGVRACASFLAQSPRRWEEAAAAAGARFGRRLFGLLLPLHARAVTGAWLLAFVFCLRDLESAALYYPPGSETLPVRIFTLEANGPPAAVAALACIQVALTAAVIAVSGLLLSRDRPS
jgi:iron(III) transport system permease protein